MNDDIRSAARLVVAAWVSTRPAWIEQCNEAVLALDAALKAHPEPAQEQAEPVCDKDPQGCWNVRCQLGKVCKNTAPTQRPPLTEEQAANRGSAEAVRIAIALEEGNFLLSRDRNATAAELRRLHAKNERIYAQHASVVSDYEKAVVTLKAQRDALLEACKAYDKWADKTLCYDRELRPIRAQIRAAIKAVEEGK